MMSKINKKRPRRMTKKGSRKKTKEITGQEFLERAGPFPEETLEEMRKERKTSSQA